MKRILTMMAACLAMAAGAAAQNPIFLNKAYNSDPQARVWTIDGKPVEHANQIDPSVFIDDDGQAWMFWGQFSAKCAKLNPDMRSIDPSTIKDGIKPIRMRFHGDDDKNLFTINSFRFE